MFKNGTEHLGAETSNFIRKRKAGSSEPPTAPETSEFLTFESFVGQFRAVKLGILGSGQLSWMLLQSAKKLGLSVDLYASHAEDQATQESARVTVGSQENHEALRTFLSRCETVLFENEFWNTDDLRSLADSSVEFFPALSAIELAQNKLSQKHLFQTLGIPTPAFRIYDSSGVGAFVRSVFQEWKTGAVLKWGRMGYDGKGVFVLDDLRNTKAAETFCERAVQKGVPLYAEEKVHFRRELALITTRGRNRDGHRDRHNEQVFFPLVETRQKHGVCELVSSLGHEAASLQTTAESWGRSIADQAGLLGTFALEIFETETGGLLANELAPRVHNSGHFSIDGASVSQFELHMRAAAGLALETPICRPWFAMWNLLGPSGIESRVRKGGWNELADRLNTEFASLEKRGIRARSFLYGKSEVRPWRKLGHIGFWADKPPTIFDVEALREIWTDWCQSLVPIRRR